MRNATIRPLPFGGQALGNMAAHALLTTLAERSLTVAQLIAEEPELDALYASIDLAGQVLVVALGFCFWILGWRRAFRRTVLAYLVVATLSVLLNCWDLVSTLTERTGGTEG